uniref:IS982 family transposase n=1 Tax=Candidatus Regiella insecticola TaxID=138073 RepID=UPI0022A74843|nr:IS982 family transposase [Candidatus Regiella insecticola]
MLTMELIGEYLGHNSDKAIWFYFKTHWLHFFPKIGCRTSFSRQCANTYALKQALQRDLSSRLSVGQALYLVDGFPIPLCHIKRYKRSKTELSSIGAVGYCAAKAAYYFGFKGHILITPQGGAVAYEITASNVHERDVVPEISAGLTGMLLADKGLIRPELNALLTRQGLNLQTPLRVNMADARPKKMVAIMMTIRRKIETVIGQLVERFDIQSIRAKDLWHLKAKVARKIVARTFCFMLNKIENHHKPLELALLIT